MENEKKTVDLASMTRAELEEYAASVSTEKTVLESKLSAEIAVLKSKLTWYEEQLRLNRRRKFGPSSEKVDFDQLSLFNEAESESDDTLPEPEMTDVVGRTGATKQKKKKQRGHKEKLTKALPKQVIEYTLSGEDLVCPKCGNELHSMKKEVRRELTVIPAKIMVTEHVTHVYSCRNCENNEIEATILKAPSPVPVFRNSLASSSFLADILTKKYMDALPLYRQEQNLHRNGLKLSRQTMANWVIRASELYLKPLYDLLHEELLKKDIVQADETTVEVLHEPGRKATTDSYMWLYRTSGCDSDRPVILFDYQPSRSGDCAVEFLKGFRGYLHTDGYVGYHKLTVAENGEKPQAIGVGCWAHARRKYYDALQAAPAGTNLKNTASARGLEYCDRLFRVEREAKEQKLSFEERKEYRLKHVRPVLKEFFAWAKETLPKADSKSKLHEALHYTVNQAEALSRYLEDGRLEISTNRAERSIKPFVIGRKNFLFMNTPKGAKASAVVYSVVETAKECRLNPFEYLNYLFEVMPGLDLSDRKSLKKLLPYAPELPDHCRLKTEDE